MFLDGDDDNGSSKNNDKKPPTQEPGDYNLGDDIGTKIGEGHDPIEDPIS